MLRPLSTIALAALAASIVAGGAFAADEQAKWFVLRNETIGSCSTGLLIKVDGEYAHAGRQIAGGPFNTKADALAREKELVRDGSCSSAS